MKKHRWLAAVLAISLTILSCTMSEAESLQEGVAATLTALAGSSGAGTAAPSNTAPAGATSPPATVTTVPATACSPTATANLNANVRKGPSTAYDAVGSLLTGQSAPIAGKLADGSWWYIDFAAGVGGKAWIAASTVTATCVPTSIAIVAAPPPPSGSCKDGYVWREIRSSDRICVPPSSKAQADADNAAAASRKCTATYGPDTCAEGYVWREAFSGDTVCVPPATRSQAQADNAAAPSRWTSGAYGPHTCVPGYVWREANGPGDDVCVTPDIRSQTASDNSAAASRLCTATYGPDTCAQGYVWREAFSGDLVCVPPANRTQAQNDNANAPSHTWP